MVLGAKCGAGRVIAGRDIIGEACMAADATVPVETAKTHGTTQLRRMNFFQFITLWVFKKLNPLEFESIAPCRIGKVTPLLLWRTVQSELPAQQPESYRDSQIV
jgi:hypothetical protein